MSVPNYEVVSSFDTETTNYNYITQNEHGREVVKHTAFTILYTLCDFRTCGVRKFEPGKDTVYLYRDEHEFIAYVNELIEWGKARKIIPIIAGYNLMFDLQTVLFDLNVRYAMKTMAQSSTNVYTLDLYEDEETKTPCLRFWDTYHLEMNGLAAMGNTAGVKKLKGDWDYSKIRTKETPITEQEKGYAIHDVEIIPAYLRYILEANPWVKYHDLGVTILTKTSLVRSFAKREIGPLKLTGKCKDSLYKAFLGLCASEFWKNFDQYALQRACFRGGFTFTAANYASQVVKNVYSLDETSAHHAFINGRYIPVRFREGTQTEITHACEQICGVTRKRLFAHYETPWLYGIHACVRFTNLHLREGSAFETWGIALIPQGKFAKVVSVPDYQGESTTVADEDVREHGYTDMAINPVFAFSKLMSADVCYIHVTEVELYAMREVYAWDDMQGMYGEIATKWVKPPDYVTLQSNVLFSQKQDMKHVLKVYTEGVPCTAELGVSLPKGIVDMVREGTATTSFLLAYYVSTVKGMFNGIYGVQSQNVLRPGYEVIEGDLFVDDTSRVTRENFSEKLPKTKKVLYTYGMRIVGGSRLQLVEAIALIWDKLRDRVRVVGGDTDSLKISCDDDVTKDDLLDALKPLHTAIYQAIERTQKRVRANFSDMVSTLDSVGQFEIENDTPYPLHMELWNKARVTWDGAHAHVTCAGLSRPAGLYTIESAIEEFIQDGHTFADAVSLMLGYNSYIDNSISHALERTHPSASDMVNLDVTDYTGHTYHVDQPEAISLYAAPRNIADTSKRTNACNVKYLRSLGRDIDISEKVVTRGPDGHVQVQKMTDEGWQYV